MLEHLQEFPASPRLESWSVTVRASRWICNLDGLGLRQTIFFKYILYMTSNYNSIKPMIISINFCFKDVWGWSARRTNRRPTSRSQPFEQSVPERLEHSDLGWAQPSLTSRRMLKEYEGMVFLY